jgi:hypothetical protein
MVVAFEILQRCAGEHLTVDGDVGRVAGQAEGLTQAVDRAAFAVRDSTGGPQCAVLPGRVAVGLPENPDGIFKLFGALDEREGKKSWVSCRL